MTYLRAYVAGTGAAIATVSIFFLVAFAVGDECFLEGARTASFICANYSLLVTFWSFLAGVLSVSALWLTLRVASNRRLRDLSRS